MVLPCELRERYLRLVDDCSVLGRDRVEALTRELTLKVACEALDVLEARVKAEVAELRRREAHVKARVVAASHILPTIEA